MQRLARAAAEIRSFKKDAMEGGIVWIGGNLMAVGLCNIALMVLSQLETLAPVTARSTPKINPEVDHVSVLIKQINDEIRDDVA